MCSVCSLIILEGVKCLFQDWGFTSKYSCTLWEETTATHTHTHKAEVFLIAHRHKSLSNQLTYASEDLPCLTFDLYKKKGTQSAKKVQVIPLIAVFPMSFRNLSVGELHSSCKRTCLDTTQPKMRCYSSTMTVTQQTWRRLKLQSPSDCVPQWQNNLHNITSQTRIKLWALHLECKLTTHISIHAKQNSYKDSVWHQPEKNQTWLQVVCVCVGGGYSVEVNHNILWRGKMKLKSK